jgi:cytochrome c2
LPAPADDNQNAGRSYVPARPNQASAAGKKIFKKHLCSNCHSIEAVGGCLGPPLDGAGARRSKSYLLDRITNSGAAKARFEKECAFELMEHPRISSSEASQVVAYLLTLPEPKGGFHVAGHKSIVENKAVSSEQSTAPATASIETGKKLFYQRGCAECHAIGTLGGQFAPNLLGIAQRHDRSYIQERITNAQLLTVPDPDEYGGKGTVMPPLNLSSEETNQIVDFLMSLPKQ